MACHNMDPAFWALDLRAPVSVEASCPGDVDSEMCPFGSVYHYKFDARGKMPPVEVTWSDVPLAAKYVATFRDLDLGPPALRRPRVLGSVATAGTGLVNRKVRRYQKARRRGSF